MFKVAERFYSIQGEGTWTGTPMYFVRLSQCPVGGQKGICRAWDGREFKCDTGASWDKKSGVEWHSYNETRESINYHDIIQFAEGAGTNRICLTGGEPLLYNLDIESLIYQLGLKDMYLHIETSGTINPPKLMGARERVWITVSPKTTSWKEDTLNEANEFKILVHKDTNIGSIRMWQSIARGRPVFLQPIDPGEGDLPCVDTAVDLAKATGCRVSLQMHKFVGVR